MGALPSDNLIRQLISIVRPLRKMREQQLADFLDAFDDGVTEFLPLKMPAHSIDNSMPEFLAAFLVNRFVADHGEFMRPGRNENEHGVALACFMHPQLMKFFLRNNQRIGVQFPTLDKNA